jgi:hypothetical protein
MCKTRLDTKIHPLPRTEDAKFESSRGVIIDPAVDAGFGATRRRRSGTAGGCEIRGNSEIHPSAPPKERGFGATRKLTVGTAGRCRIRGDPERRIRGVAGGAKIRGNPEFHRRYRRRARESRKLEDPPPARPEDAGFGATRRCMGKVERDDA